MRSYPLSLLLLVFLVTSCKPIFFQVKNNKKAKMIEEFYTNDTLHIQNYIYYRDSIFQGKWLDDKVSFRYEDSMMAQFKNALQKVPLNIQWQQPMLNVCDTIIPNIGLTIRARKIPDHLILDKIVADSNKTILLPVIQTLINRQYSVGGGYSFSYVNWLGWDEFNIIFYVIKNNCIIYKRAIRCAASHKEDEKFHGIDKYITRMRPEFWDTAVQMVMEDYMKRIKK